MVKHIATTYPQMPVTLEELERTPFITELLKAINNK
jgi:hypothetical protein